MEQTLRDFFETNFERLRLEGGHSLAPDVKETAFRQVVAYWRRLTEIAQHVTDTEVALSLPQQVSPDGRSFTIEGVVDIVRMGDSTVMYDIKTHDAESVRGELELYGPQLNVYAYIWQELRGMPLDAAAVIATRIPPALETAMVNADDEQTELELELWDPVVPVPIDAGSVRQTIRDFGEAVDSIENGRFAPKSLEQLRRRGGRSGVPFAVEVCRNCDVRFSCEPYRAYALESPGRRDSPFRKYLENLESEEEREFRIASGLDTADDPGTLRESL